MGKGRGVVLRVPISKKCQRAGIQSKVVVSSSSWCAVVGVQLLVEVVKEGPGGSSWNNFSRRFFSSSPLPLVFSLILVPY